MIRDYDDDRDEYGLLPSDWDIVDGQRVLKDGRTLRVRTMMRDGMREGDDMLLADAFGRQPGYVRIADAAERARSYELKARAWENAQADAESAWRSDDARARLVAASARDAALTLDEVLVMDDAARRGVKEDAWYQAQLADETAWRSPGK